MEKKVNICDKCNKRISKLKCNICEKDLCVICIHKVNLTFSGHTEREVYSEKKGNAMSRILMERAIGENTRTFKSEVMNISMCGSCANFIKSYSKNKDSFEKIKKELIEELKQQKTIDNL